MVTARPLWRSQKKRELSARLESGGFMLEIKRTIENEVIVQFRHYVETGRPLSGDVLGLTQPATA